MKFARRRLQETQQRNGNGNSTRRSLGLNAHLFIQELECMVFSEQLQF